MKIEMNNWLCSGVLRVDWVDSCLMRGNGSAKESLIKDRALVYFSRTADAIRACGSIRVLVYLRHVSLSLSSDLCSCTPPLACFYAADTRWWDRFGTRHQLVVPASAPAPARVLLLLTRVCVCSVSVCVAIGFVCCCCYCCLLSFIYF